mmetsp:Transcript_45178/g.114373  ORF Transcript_45178/g.114373 Transcript_45178/m.114373 type:complete len:207 (+) Transcript_45178:591-1211(+)
MSSAERTGRVGSSCLAGLGSGMPYTADSWRRPARLAMMVTEGCTSVRRSMGTTPAATISALDAAKRGRTSPGQSHSVILVPSICSVWKCFVLPGVGATAVFLLPKSALMVEDLPTLGYPISPTISLGSSRSPGSAPLSATHSSANSVKRSMSVSMSSTAVRASSPAAGCLLCKAGASSTPEVAAWSFASSRACFASSTALRADQNA